MIEYLVWSIVIGSVASFVLTLGYKWELVERLQKWAPNKFFGSLFSCQFCMTFWLSVVLSAVALAFVGEWWLMLVPLTSAKIGLKLLG